MPLPRHLAGDALAELLLVLAPGLGGPPRLDRLHRDAAGDRADEHAEVAAHALLLEDLRDLPAVDEADRLVGPVLAGHVAEVAAHALRAVDLRDDLEIEVEVAPVLDAGQAQPAEVPERPVAPLV